MSIVRLTLPRKLLGDETFFKYKAEYKSAVEQVRSKLGEVETLLASGAAENSEEYKYLEQYRDMIKDTLADYEKQADESIDSVRLPESDSLGSTISYEEYRARCLRRVRHPRRTTTLREYIEAIEENNGSEK